MKNRKWKKKTAFRNKWTNTPAYKAMAPIFSRADVVSGYSLETTLKSGKPVYEVFLDINLIPVEHRTNVRKYAIEVLLFPKKIFGADVEYEAHEVKLSANWTSHSEWSRLRDQTTVFLPDTDYVNEPYTTDSGTLSLRVKHDTIKGGIEINRGSSLGRWNATLGFIVWDAVDGTPYILSAAHVMCLNRYFENFTVTKGTAPEDVGLPIYQPRYPRKIGELAAWGTQDDTTGATNIDAAIATIDAGVLYDPEEYGIIGHVENAPAIEPELNARVMTVGRSSGFSPDGYVYNKSFVFQPSGWPACLTYVITQASVGGDSGSPVMVSTGSKNPIGIILGYFGSLGIVLPALSIEEDLGITFTMPSPPVMGDGGKPFINLFF